MTSVNGSISLVQFLACGCHTAIKHKRQTAPPGDAYDFKQAIEI